VSVKDEQVRKLVKELGKGTTQSVAAARSGMCRQTAAKYMKAGKLPSEMRKERTWLTRDNPFESDWKEVERMLGNSPNLQAKTIFHVLSERNPDRYEPGQLRTLQRHISRWRALQGDDREQEVFFPQQHVPGEAMQGDFTHTGELKLTLAGEVYKPLLFHAVLPFSGWQWATPCRSESLLALRVGVQDAVFQLGKVPTWFQTDNSTGATHRIRDGGRRFHDEYEDLMTHLGMKPRTTAVGKKEQNGSVEAHNGAFKRLLEQWLLVRGSREFADEAVFLTWLHEMLERSNRSRAKKLAIEVDTMRSLVAVRAPEFAEYTVPVSSYSTINVRSNIYSVPPRLRHHDVKVRVYEQRIEVRYAGQLVLTAPRQLGTHRHAIDYRHVIWALVRKPGAFARYRYREDMMISPAFRRAYEVLQAAEPGIRGDAAYLRLLLLAASTLQSDVEAALALLMDNGKLPTADAVKDLVEPQERTQVPDMPELQVCLEDYDHLITGACS
jgi:hypothetical protein